VDSQIYNNMASESVTVKGAKEIDVTPRSKVKSVHFTNCLKPWVCPRNHQPTSLCARFHRTWWDIRRDYEESVGLPVAMSCFADRGTSYRAVQVPERPRH
jgi:hypothetical protein